MIPARGLLINELTNSRMGGKKKEIYPVFFFHIEDDLKGG